MHCHHHNQGQAIGACVYCGKLFCAECLVEADGKYYCKEHVKLLFSNQSQEGYRYDNPYEEKPYDERYCGPPLPTIYIREKQPAEYFSPNNRLAAFLLCLFFGVAGFHRMYVGKIGTGIIWLFTGGLLGIGYLADLFAIIFGFFRDSRGRLLR